MTATVHTLRSRHETAPKSEAAERLREEANPREVAKHVASMEPGMLRCRRLRTHKWEPSFAEKVRGGWTETLVCERCGAEKDRRYNGRGKVVDYGSPRYQDGYLIEGFGRMGQEARDVINLTSLRVDMQVQAAATKTRRRKRA